MKICREKIGKIILPEWAGARIHPQILEHTNSTKFPHLLIVFPDFYEFTFSFMHKKKKPSQNNS